MDKRKLAVFAILGSLLSRWHGGGFFSAPKLLKTVLFALFPAVCLGFMIPNDNVWTWLGWITFALVVTGAVKASGHGMYFSLGYTDKTEIKPEKIDFIVKLFFGKDPREKKDKKYE